MLTDERTERKTELWLAAMASATLVVVFVVAALLGAFDVVLTDEAGVVVGVIPRAGAVQAWGTLCTTIGAASLGYMTARAAKKIQELRA